MSSPWKKQPEDVVDSVLKRAEVSKVSWTTVQGVSPYELNPSHNGWKLGRIRTLSNTSLPLSSI
jgi:hypothetical protein